MNSLAIRKAQPYRSSDASFVDTDFLYEFPKNRDLGVGDMRIRFAQLSGYDYIFVAAPQAARLSEKESLSEFVARIHQRLETCSDRARIYIYTDAIYTDNNLASTEFAALSLHWAKGQVQEFRLVPIKNLAQKEFIQTLFDHSLLFGDGQ